MQFDGYLAQLSEEGDDAEMSGPGAAPGVPTDKNNIAAFPYQLQPPERYIPMGSLLFLFFKTASHPGSWAVKWAMLCYHSAII